jgi:hypothetical protein
MVGLSQEEKGAEMARDVVAEVLQHDLVENSWAVPSKNLL